MCCADSVHVHSCHRYPGVLPVGRDGGVLSRPAAVLLCVLTVAVPCRAWRQRPRMWLTRVWWRTSRGTNTTQTSLAQWGTTSSSSCGTHASRHGTVSTHDHSVPCLRQGSAGTARCVRVCVCVVWACSGHGGGGGQCQQEAKVLAEVGQAGCPPATVSTSSLASCWLCVTRFRWCLWLVVLPARMRAERAPLLSQRWIEWQA